MSKEKNKRGKKVREREGNPKISLIYVHSHFSLILLCVQKVVTPIYLVTYYIKWVTTSRTDGMVKRKPLQAHE